MSHPDPTWADLIACPVCEGDWLENGRCSICQYEVPDMVDDFDPDYENDRRAS